MLAVADPTHTSFEPLAAFKAKVTQEVADFLGVPFGVGLSGAAGSLGVGPGPARLATQAAGHFRPDPLRLRGHLGHVVKKLAASSPALNFLGACLAWNLEVTGICGLVAHHLAGALNDEADWLSRPEKQSAAGPPPALAHLTLIWLHGARFLLFENLQKGERCADDRGCVGCGVSSVELR